MLIDLRGYGASQVGALMFGVKIFDIKAYGRSKIIKNTYEINGELSSVLANLCSSIVFVFRFNTIFVVNGSLFAVEVLLLDHNQITRQKFRRSSNS